MRTASIKAKDTTAATAALAELSEVEMARQSAAVIWRRSCISDLLKFRSARRISGAAGILL